MQLLIKEKRASSSKGRCEVSHAARGFSSSELFKNTGSILDQHYESFHCGLIKDLDLKVYIRSAVLGSLHLDLEHSSYIIDI
jgi:hypothetical protein